MPLAAPHREALIAACPLFAGLDADGMAAVAQATVEVEFPADRTIARQGEIGTGLFIVAEGAVRVVRDGEIVIRLGPGEFFGELSVLDGGPRNASVDRGRAHDLPGARHVGRRTGAARTAGRGAGCPAGPGGAPSRGHGGPPDIASMGRVRALPGDRVTA